MNTLHVRAGAEVPERAFLGKASDAQLEVMNDVLAERSRQDIRWGGPSHDDKHTAIEFVDLIEDFAGKARRHAALKDENEARRRLVQIAALAMAAIEAMDRR